MSYSIALQLNNDVPQLGQALLRQPDTQAFLRVPLMQLHQSTSPHSLRRLNNIAKKPSLVLLQSHSMRRNVQRLGRVLQRGQPIPTNWELGVHRGIIVSLMYARQQSARIALVPPKPVYTVVQLGISSSHHALRFGVLPRPGFVAVLLFLALARSGTPYRFLQFRIDHAAGVRAVRALQAQTFVLRSSC